jgi:hypothetical protein
MRLLPARSLLLLFAPFLVKSVGHCSFSLPFAPAEGQEITAFVQRFPAIMRAMVMRRKSTHDYVKQWN